MRVPEQVQLIGYDGLRVLNVGDYAVSSIAQPVRRMAMSCVDVLLKLIEKARRRQRHPSGEIRGWRHDKIEETGKRF